MSNPMQPDDTLLDLLVKQAVEGLTAAETAALQAAERAPGGGRVTA